MLNNTDNQIIQVARELLSGCFQGILATHSIECAGYPIGSLLPYSLDRDGWPLILVSHLAKHTRNLSADQHCSLTIVEHSRAETQTLTRLSCLADAAPWKTLTKGVLNATSVTSPKTVATTMNSIFTSIDCNRYVFTASPDSVRRAG